MTSISKSSVSFIKYCWVAILGAIVDWSFFLCLLLIGCSATLVQPISRLAGGVTSFTLNGLWSFGLNRKPSLEIQGLRFVALYIASFLLAYASFLFFSPMGPMLSKLIADVCCFCFNFLVMQRWVFRLS